MGRTHDIYLVPGFLGFANLALYRVLHQICATEGPERVSPKPALDQSRALRRAFGTMPSPDANDGIAPTLSQTWGHVVQPTAADRLDVFGHFRARRVGSAGRRRGGDEVELSSTDDAGASTLGIERK
jgi:hypothetical protein